MGHGMPTDEDGKEGPAVLRDFERAVRNLSKMPVRIVFRLCTEDEAVMDTFQKLGNKFDTGFCDVVRNYWAESKKVHMHNPWLTYAIGIHRLREAGLAWGLLNSLDKRPLTLLEVHEFCKMLFPEEIPHPRNWNEFYQSLARLAGGEKTTWNPTANKKTLWLNLPKLREKYGP